MRTQDINQLSRTLHSTKSCYWTSTIKKIFLGLFLFSITTQLFAQVNELPEIEITAVNYKYLNTVATEDISDLTIKMLEKKAAFYNLEDYKNYNTDYNIYNVTFSMPGGQIQAVYDENGKIVKTIEKFKNVLLPKHIRFAIGKRFPNWSLLKNAYQVSYHECNCDCDCDHSTLTEKKYRLKLKNGNEVVTVKTDETGAFL